LSALRRSAAATFAGWNGRFTRSSARRPTFVAPDVSPVEMKRRFGEFPLRVQEPRHSFGPDRFGVNDGIGFER
jgi:hypothetical protein